MSTKKMVDKAKEVIEKQKELNYLVIEMKNEVRSVEDENQKLQEEIAALREQLKQGSSSIVLKEDLHKVEKTEVKQVETKVKEVQTKSVTIPIEIKKEVKEDKPSKKRTETQNTLIEFFLGKNVIVKIAAVLMVLAIITFGQIAYVDFLNDVGRFIFILAVGFLFIGLGYFFERKEVDVFGNIFYIVGLAVLLANNFLGLNEYELYDNFVFMYLLVPLVLGPLLYFYQKRYSFLDFALNIYYLVIMFAPILIFNNTNIYRPAFLLITLIILLSGFAIYRNYSHNMIKYDKFAVVEFVVLLIAMITIILTSSEIISTTSISFAHVNVLMYQVFFVFIYYVIHFKNVEEREQAASITILVTTTIAFFILGSSLSSTFNVFINRDNTSLSTLFTVLLFIPIYVYMFKKKTDAKLLNAYLIIIALTALFFTFSVNMENVTSNGNHFWIGLHPYLKNIILVTEVIVLYLFSRITKDKIQKYVSYGFMGITLLFTLIHFLSNTIGFEDYKFFIPTILSGIVVYILFVFVNPSQREKEEHDVVKLFGLAVFIPFIMVFTKDLILDDRAVISSAVVFYLIGIRYLFNIKLFKSRYQTEFTIGLISVIVLITFITNFFYFDHDFTLFGDLFKLLCVGLINVYLIQGLREVGLFVNGKLNIESENTFIVFYVLGVIIQAVFITQYINFEFDKVILSSYYMISAAVAILYGFRINWFNVRKIGLFAIYFSLAKFFIYDLWTNDFDKYVRFLSYFILAVVLFGIAALYSYLEKTYGPDREIKENIEK